VSCRATENNRRVTPWTDRSQDGDRGGHRRLAFLVFPGQAQAADTCTTFGTITQSKYYIDNNGWRAGNANGCQCVWDTYQSGSTIGWGTSWNRTSRSPSQDNQVKS
jgi:hypothetical protein